MSLSDSKVTCGKVGLNSSGISTAMVSFIEMIFFSEIKRINGYGLIIVIALYHYFHMGMT